MYERLSDTGANQTDRWATLTPTDKSAGDTSDIISDSSGVGTSNSDTTCSLHGGATVVCLQPYDGATPGHVRLNQGDIVEGRVSDILASANRG